MPAVHVQHMEHCGIAVKDVFAKLSTIRTFFFSFFFHFGALNCFLYTVCYLLLLACVIQRFIHINASIVIVVLLKLIFVHKCDIIIECHSDL